MQGQKSIANEMGVGRMVSNVMVSNFVPPMIGLVHDTMHETMLSCSTLEDVA